MGICLTQREVGRVKFTWFYFCVLMGLILGTNLRAVEFFELEPILYSKTAPENRVESLKLIEEFGVGVRSERAFLELVLRSLDVPESSQVLVYSKTSLQRGHISMSRPRAIFFNDTTYVGYVKGGDIEVAIHDENIGVAFYIIRPPREVGGKPQIERPDSCLSCHVSRRTNDIPGVFIRSVSVDEETQQIRPGSFDTTHASPYEERWGGWYVTGDWDENKHLGNTTEIRQTLGKKSELGELDFLNDMYPRKTSDIVALAVLEHQCMVHNALIMAKLRYERAWFLYKAIEPSASQNDTSSSAWRVANSLAEGVVRKLLFQGEAEMLGDGLSGSEDFVSAFESATTGSEGKTKLRKVRGVGRLFKYHCSYMVYSPSFEALPDIVKNLIYSKLKTALTTDSDVLGIHLSAREKLQVFHVLDEVLDW